MLRNCQICGRLLTLPDGMPCPACLAEEDAAIERIRRYLEEGRPASLASVSRDLGLRISLLRRMQASGRIQLAEEKRRCRICGNPVETGEVCPDCVRKFGTSQHTPPATPPPPQARPSASAAQSRMYGRSGSRGSGRSER